MTVSLLMNSQMQFGALTFFAKQHKGDTCGSNGLPLTPNSIIIFGKAQILKTIKHRYLCEYLDIIRGKHERTIVVSQYCGKPLSDLIGKEQFSFDDIKRIAFQLITAVNVLHEQKIVHRNLSSCNILLQDNNDIKLFNYGLYYMTAGGQLVSFPIISLLYNAPEVYLDGPTNSLSNPKVDIWSIGIILAELLLHKSLWNSLKLGQRIRKVLSLLQCNTSIFERIAREHNVYEYYLELPQDIKEIVELCLNIYPKNRPSCQELLDKDIFKNYRQTRPIMNRSKVCEQFEVFTIKELYHWWQLAGGDVYQELKKQGLIRSSPPILSLPNLVLNEGYILGQERNPATLYDPRVVQMPLDTLYKRLAHLPYTSFFPLIHCKSEILLNVEPPPSSSLPLVIKERDPEYQFHRVILLRRLLHGYPFTKHLIVREAENDIPPLLRGEIWSALLGVSGDYEKEYLKIDKDSPTATDRQIEVDIPRCHQYNELLSSTEGHKKLKRILKAWVYKNSNYVYWQGLDSLSAPFLYLNFNNEAKAFACLSAFVPKYLHKFFLKDNSVIIEEYLAKFSQLIAFHDPELANHLYTINFYPQLFAIPWFLTVFSHVFPLYKILHLWDKLLLGDSSYPLHIGLSVLTQLRDRLLTSGFNECILLFSDLPEVDIEKCVTLSSATFESTPKSITAREHENEDYCKKGDLDVSGVGLEELKRETSPRISANDVIYLLRNTPKQVLIVDIRNPTQFARCSVVGSINIPSSSVSFGENNLENIGAHYTAIKNGKDQIIVVVGNEETDLDLFPKFLLKCKVSKVCVLHNGFNTLLSAPAILTNCNLNI